MAAVRDALAAVSMPTEPEDGQNSERVSDLVVMADTLEHRQGVSHVAFNFLVAEICGALEQGLEAGNAEIAQRWGSANSRDYVSRMLRGLTEGDFFPPRGLLMAGGRYRTPPPAPHLQPEPRQRVGRPAC